MLNIKPKDISIITKNGAEDKVKIRPSKPCPDDVFLDIVGAMIHRQFQSMSDSITDKTFTKQQAYDQAINFLGSLALVLGASMDDEISVPTPEKTSQQETR